jgi:hypothetical protein
LDAQTAAVAAAAAAAAACLEPLLLLLPLSLFRGRLELVMVLKSKECCRHVMSGWDVDSFQQLGGDPAKR